MNIKSLIKGEMKQQELLNWYNATILYDTLPRIVNGYVFNYDGVYFIVLNNNLGLYKRKTALLHELAHIELNQLCQSNKDLFEYYIEQYEDEADRYIKEIMK